MPIQRPISLRRFSFSLPIVLAAFVLVPAVGLTRTSTLIWRAGQVHIDDMEAILISTSIDRTLREYQRVSNVLVISPSPELESARADLKVELRSLLEEIRVQANAGTKSEMLSDLSESIDRYLRFRSSIDESNTPLVEIVRSSTPFLDRALASSRLLREFNEADMLRSQADAQRMFSFGILFAVIPSLVLIAALTGVIFGMRSLILRPIFALQTTINRFQSGEIHARAPKSRATELRDLSSAFNDMAETIERQRREQLTFLAGVAHDFRNPLSTLKMAIQVMEEDPSAISPERLAKVDTQIDRLNRMVGDLLDASRIEAGALELRVENLDLRESAKTMVELYAPMTSRHELVLKARDESVMIRCDPLRIEQVIGNLLSNAIKYSPDGGLIEISVERSESRALLSVSDHGIGIPPEDLSHIFTPFRRQLASSQIIPGVGLGLSIVRRITLAHQGTIQVESRPGAGSTFRISLPLIPDEEARVDIASETPK